MRDEATLEQGSPPARARGRPNWRVVHEPRHNLPVQLSSFVGRACEIDEVRRLLASSRVLTLTGAGGVGKTRLALEVASLLLDDFADGVWLVELAVLADPALVPRAVASALGVLEEPGRPLVETLVDVLRAKQTLLLIDNCEPTISACAELVERLLRICPHLRILATSREPLGLVGETVWRVPSLSLPVPVSPGVHGLDLVAALARSEAVRLFVDRAQAALPAFRLAEQNAAAVAQICQCLDGIPLAIELAAPRIKALSAEQIAARIGDRFRLLTAGSRTAVPRHRTLRALIDSSYELLSRPEQLLLARLSVFAGGWDLEAAEAVCDADAVVDVLAQLVDRSLVQVEERHGEIRYRLLETVRQYAQEKLREAGEEVALRIRHRDYFLAFAERAERQLVGSNALTWFDRIDREHDNLRAALDWCEQQPGGAEPGLSLAAALVRFWDVRGYSGEGRERLGRLLALAPDETVARARALHQAGHLCYLLGDMAAARQMLEQGWELSRRLGYAFGAALSLQVLVGVSLIEGNIDEAERLSESCCPLWQAEGSVIGRFHWLTWRAYIARSRQDYALAATLLEEALGLARAQQDPWAIATCLRALGASEVGRGDSGRAEALLRESLAMRCEMRHERGVTDCVEGLAWTAAAAGRGERAARLLGAAEARREDSGTPLLLAWRSDHERALEATRVLLGEARLSQIWKEGRRTPPGAAIRYALEGDTGSPARPTGRRAAGRDASPLTARELEVAALIGRGLKNREIAVELVITEGTAALHVKNILRKLQVNSRAQVAAWSVQEGLARPAVGR